MQYCGKNKEDVKMSKRNNDEAKTLSDVVGAGKCTCGCNKNENSIKHLQDCREEDIMNLSFRQFAVFPW